MKDIQIKLKENEEKLLPIIWTGGSEEISVSAKLIGRGAKLTILGAVFLAAKDQIKLDINIEHIAPDTTSNTLIKSALTDRARGNFYGLVKIKKGAKNTNTYFREDALLLSKQAKAEAIPSLEIDENEVKAGHASTVGPLDPEQLFYLTSKGITQNEAKKLVVQGYFFNIFEQLSPNNSKNFANFLSKKLNFN